MKILHEFIISDHRPILIELNVNCQATGNDEKSSNLSGIHSEFIKTNINWCRIAMTDNSFYYDYTKYELSKLRIPWDDYYGNLISTLQTGSDALVRKQTVTKRSHNRKSIPGWTINLSQYHQQAKVHYKEWLKCKTCKPDSDVMFEKMKSSRKKFKKELRKHKRKLRQKFADDLAAKMIGNHPFWKQIKRINSGSTCTASLSIDGITGDQNLAMMWKENYRQILNSVDERISRAILQSFEDANHYVKAEKYYCTVELVKSLASKLKLTSAPELDGLQAEHIMHSHEFIYLHLTILFNLCLSHNFIPASCIASVITLIVKNKQDDAGVSSNYRPITVASV